MGTWLPVAAYVGLVFAFSSIPNLAPPGEFSFSDKIAHFFEYGVMGGLLYRALHREGVSPARRIPILIVMGAVIALLDEVYQGTVGRETSLADWIADVIGLAAAGFVGAWFVGRKRKGTA